MATLGRRRGARGAQLPHCFRQFRNGMQLTLPSCPSYRDPLHNEFKLFVMEKILNHCKKFVMKTEQEGIGEVLHILCY